VVKGELQVLMGEGKPDELTVFFFLVPSIVMAVLLLFPPKDVILWDVPGWLQAKKNQVHC